ncbi:MAG: MFS transporter [Chloroflexi bacterium]|nr:MFS transporter [Chloroflexota bacterium]
MLMFAQTGRSVVGRLQNHTFAALVRHPNYRLYWSGALASNTGYWIQVTAQGWLVYQITGSAFFLGAVAFATTVPNIFLPPFGGVLADRFERRLLMVGSQTASMLLALILAYLTLTGAVTVWHLLVIAFLSGSVEALTVPIRQSIVWDLVSKEDLMNAIAVNSAGFHSSRMVGPALAGGILVLTGPGVCFLINGISYLAIIAALLAVKMPKLSPDGNKVSMWTNLADGLAYVRSVPIISSLMVVAAIPSLFGMSYNALMPAFASSVLGVDAHGLGLLMSAAGLGAMIGAVGVASLGRSVPRGKLLLGAVIALGLSLTVFATSSSFPLSMVMLVGVGGTTIVYNVLTQTILQVQSDNQMRGRVLSVFALASYGLQPFGQLGAGVVADYLGAPTAVFLGGAICTLFALFVLVRQPETRRLT